LKIIALALYLLGFSLCASINQEGASPSSLIPLCASPQYIHPEARQLTRDFKKGYLSKSEYLERFVWLEPSNEEYALCVVCSGNDVEYFEWSMDTAIFCHNELELPFHI
jgi:hypothetical protein